METEGDTYGAMETSQSTDFNMPGFVRSEDVGTVCGPELADADNVGLTGRVKLGTERLWHGSQQVSRGVGAWLVKRTKDVAEYRKDWEPRKTPISRLFPSAQPAAVVSVTEKATSVKQPTVPQLSQQSCDQETAITASTSASVTAHSVPPQPEGSRSMEESASCELKRDSSSLVPGSDAAPERAKASHMVLPAERTPQSVKECEDLRLEEGDESCVKWRSAGCCLLDACRTCTTRTPKSHVALTSCLCLGGELIVHCSRLAKGFNYASTAGGTIKNFVCCCRSLC